MQVPIVWDQHDEHAPQDAFTRCTSTHSVIYIETPPVSPFRECWEMLVPKFTPFPVHILNKYLTFERIQIPRLFLGV